MEGEGTGTGLNSGVKTTHSNRSDRNSGSRTEMETIRQVQASYGAQALLEAWSGEEEARVRIFLRNKKRQRGREEGKRTRGAEESGTKSGPHLGMPAASGAPVALEHASTQKHV